MILSVLAKVSRMFRKENPTLLDMEGKSGPEDCIFGYVVGGWVRDKLLGQESHDMDFIIQFRCLDFFLRNFKVLFCKELEKNYPNKAIDYSMSEIQLKSGACSGKYFSRVTVSLGQSNEPNRVEFQFDFREFEEENAKETDIETRDFTINSIYYDFFKRNLENSQGIEDLNDGLLLHNGVPSKTFGLDPGRYLRAIRFMVLKNLHLDKTTESHMKKFGRSGITSFIDKGSYLAIEYAKLFSEASPKKFQDLIRNLLIFELYPLQREGIDQKQIDNFLARLSDNEKTKRFARYSSERTVRVLAVYFFASKFSSEDTFGLKDAERILNLMSRKPKDKDEDEIYKALKEGVEARCVELRLIYKVGTGELPPTSKNDFFMEGKITGKSNSKSPSPKPNERTANDSETHSKERSKVQEGENPSSRNRGPVTSEETQKRERESFGDTEGREDNKMRGVQAVGQGRINANPRAATKEKEDSFVRSSLKRYSQSIGLECDSLSSFPISLVPFFDDFSNLDNFLIHIIGDFKLQPNLVRKYIGLEYSKLHHLMMEITVLKLLFREGSRIKIKEDLRTMIFYLIMIKHEEFPIEVFVKKESEIIKGRAKLLSDAWKNNQIETQKGAKLKYLALLYALETIERGGYVEDYSLDFDKWVEKIKKNK